MEVLSEELVYIYIYRKKTETQNMVPKAKQILFGFWYGTQLRPPLIFICLLCNSGRRADILASKFYNGL